MDVLGSCSAYDFDVILMRPARYTYVGGNNLTSRHNWAKEDVGLFST